MTQADSALIRLIIIDIFSKVDCNWSEWNQWSSCSKTCNEKRERSILHVEKNGGTPCDDLSYSTRDCISSAYACKGCNQTICQASKDIVTRFFTRKNDVIITYGLDELNYAFSITEIDFLKSAGRITEEVFSYF